MARSVRNTASTAELTFGVGTLVRTNHAKLSEDHVGHGAAVHHQRQLPQGFGGGTSLDGAGHRPVVLRSGRAYDLLHVLFRDCLLAGRVEDQTLDVRPQAGHILARAIGERAAPPARQWSSPLSRRDRAPISLPRTHQPARCTRRQSPWRSAALVNDRRLIETFRNQHEAAGIYRRPQVGLERLEIARARFAFLLWIEQTARHGGAGPRAWAPSSEGSARRPRRPPQWPRRRTDDRR